MIAIVLFLAHSKAADAVRAHPLPHTLQAALQSGPVMAWLILLPAFCAAASFASMGLFVRLLTTRIPVFDNLSRNAYGIFLIHFVFVSWIGYALAGVEAPALIEFALVFPSSLAASWVGTILLRRIPGAARFI